MPVRKFHVRINVLEQYFQAMATNLILLKSHENYIVSQHTCQHFRRNSFKTYRIHRIQSSDWLLRKDYVTMLLACGDTEKFHRKSFFVAANKQQNQIDLILLLVAGNNNYVTGNKKMLLTTKKTLILKVS